MARELGLRVFPRELLGCKTFADFVRLVADISVPYAAPAERLAFEKELLGFYVTGHPMDNYRGLAEAIEGLRRGLESMGFQDAAFRQSVMKILGDVMSPDQRRISRSQRGEKPAGWASTFG